MHGAGEQIAIGFIAQAWCNFLGDIVDPNGEGTNFTLLIQHSPDWGAGMDAWYAVKDLRFPFVLVIIVSSASSCWACVVVQDRRGSLQMCASLLASFQCTLTIMRHLCGNAYIHRGFKVVRLHAPVQRGVRRHLRRIYQPHHHENDKRFCAPPVESRAGRQYASRCNVGR